MTNTDNNKILAKIEEDSIHNLQEKGARYIYFLDSQNSIIQTDKYYYLYNLQTEKKSKIEFDAYESLGSGLIAFKRLGMWMLYDTQKQVFKTDLALTGGELPVYQKGWLIENYDPLSTNSPSESELTREIEQRQLKQTHLFRASELKPYKKEVQDTPIIFYPPSNPTLRIEVPPNHRAQAHHKYLLYEDENGFHIIDSTGNYLMKNKNWDEACILVFRETNSLICLFKKGSDLGLFDVSRSSSTGVSPTIRSYKDNTYSASTFFILDSDYRVWKGAWVYNNSQNRLVIFPMLYAHIYEHRIDLEGNSWILVEKEDNYYWVNEAGEQIFLLYKE